MPAAAKPFDFAEFDAPTPDSDDAPTIALATAAAPAPAKTYSQEEMDAAVASARADAAKSVAAEEALKQTALLNAIAARFTDTADAETVGMERHIETLTNLAETIVTKYCKAVGVAHPVDAALAMLDRYLRAADESAGATLVLPVKTTKRTRTAIEKALAQRGSDHIAIATDESLSRGEMRLEWRNGAMTQNHDALEKQIKDLFAAAKPISPQRSSRKEQLS